MEQIITDSGLVGWRGYALARPKFLTCMGTVIEPYTRAEAWCENNNDHLAPDEKCTCGFYSFKTFQELIDQGYGGQDLFAEVYYWGKVIDCKLGYRAQYCYPKKLYGVLPELEFLASVYGVPFERREPPKRNKSTSVATKTTVSFEQYWDVAFNDRISLEIRKFARQQIRQRVYMKQRSKEQRQKWLEEDLVRVIKQRKELQHQMQLIDELKQELHK